MKDGLKNCYLYYGSTKHTRMKGGATHNFSYPICFAYIDIDEISQLGWSVWPIFKLNSPWMAFSSLENRHHLSHLNCNNNSFDLPSRVREFIKNNTNNKRQAASISILTHLTYFGYCFNPISIYFVNYDSVKKQRNDDEFQELIVVEVSNTPWIEQHSYMLDENAENVTIQRNHKNDTIDATWLKEFHVSPFMEMDYQYNFVFSRPSETLCVQSKLIKLTTKEIWFTASFKLTRMPFSPCNILYILLFYPLHTRIIQVLIHWEAVKLWMKGVPTFEHPNKVDINFGFGITDKHLISLYSLVTCYFNNIISIFKGRNN